MATPLIGLTTRNIKSPSSGFPMIASPRSYPQALVRSGGIPMLIPVNLPAESLHDLLLHLDGIIFTGGGDLDPVRFNSETHPKVYDVDPERDQNEFDLFEKVRAANMPFLGICRGIQLINVALGGTLYTHIEDQLPHALSHDCYPANPPDYLAHPVKIQPGSRLAQALGVDQTQVNSLHHQGIKDLAPGVEPQAWAPDGLVEGIQVPGNPFGLAVQWHPEWLQTDPAAQAFFAAFLKTAQEYQVNRRAYRTSTELAA